MNWCQPVNKPLKLVYFRIYAPLNLSELISWYRSPIKLYVYSPRYFVEAVSQKAHERESSNDTKLHITIWVQSILWNMHTALFCVY